MFYESDIIINNLSDYINAIVQLRVRNDKKEFFQ